MKNIHLLNLELKNIFFAKNIPKSPKIKLWQAPSSAKQCYKVFSVAHGWQSNNLEVEGFKNVLIVVRKKAF